MAQDIIARAMASKAASLGGGTKLYKHKLNGTLKLTVVDSTLNFQFVAIDNSASNDISLPYQIENIVRAYIVVYNGEDLYNAIDADAECISYNNTYDDLAENVLNMAYTSDVETITIDTSSYTTTEL